VRSCPARNPLGGARCARRGAVGRGFIAEGFVEGMHVPHRWNGLGIMFGTNAIVRIAARLGRTLAP
jgi:hypothetical protein